jgi:hypothetical protein
VGKSEEGGLAVMGEVLLADVLAHAGEIHGFPPFAILFLAILVMGIGLAVAVRRPPDSTDSEPADSDEERSTPLP